MSPWMFNYAVNEGSRLVDYDFGACLEPMHGFLVCSYCLTSVVTQKSVIKPPVFRDSGLSRSDELTQKSNMQILTTPLLIKASHNWKQRECLPIDKWVNLIWIIYLREYYSSIYREALDLIIIIRVNLKRIELIERRLTQMNKYD